MKHNTIPISLLRSPLPIVIGDDLRIVLAGRRKGEVQLTPSEAVAVGCRLIRQASVVDRNIASKSSQPRKHKAK